MTENSSSQPAAAVRPRAVFLTGRFRSGSTALWNIFRNIPGCLAYYEPLHDMLLTHIDCRTASTESHPGVASYWDEYYPILDGLRRVHRSEFGVTRLYMEAGADYEALAEYIEFLIASAGERLPVLKFNRVGFRLPWLERRFPDAVIIHIWRNSRDQWYSTVRAEPRQRWGDPDLATTYELMTWSCALAPEFPFLFSPAVKSSYHRHYLLWRLSKLAGERRSALSIAFTNDLLASPDRTFTRLLDAAGLAADSKALCALLAVTRTGGWREFAGDDWFDSAEEECDLLLGRLGLVDGFGRRPLCEIVAENRAAWAEFGAGCARAAMDRSLRLFSESRTQALSNSYSSHQQYLMLQELRRAAASPLTAKDPAR